MVGRDTIVVCIWLLGVVPRRRSRNLSWRPRSGCQKRSKTVLTWISQGHTVGRVSVRKSLMLQCWRLWCRGMDQSPKSPKNRSFGSWKWPWCPFFQSDLSRHIIFVDSFGHFISILKSSSLVLFCWKIASLQKLDPDVHLKAKLDVQQPKRRKLSFAAAFVFCAFRSFFFQVWDHRQLGMDQVLWLTTFISHVFCFWYLGSSFFMARQFRCVVPRFRCSWKLGVERLLEVVRKDAVKFPRDVGQVSGRFTFRCQETSTLELQKKIRNNCTFFLCLTWVNYTFSSTKKNTTQSASGNHQKKTTTEGLVTQIHSLGRCLELLLGTVEEVLG